MSLVSLLANACNLLKDAASRKDQDPPAAGPQGLYEGVSKGLINGAYRV